MIIKLQVLTSASISILDISDKTFFHESLIYTGHVEESEVCRHKIMILHTGSPVSTCFFVLICAKKKIKLQYNTIWFIANLMRFWCPISHTRHFDTSLSMPVTGIIPLFIWPLKFHEQFGEDRSRGSASWTMKRNMHRIWRGRTLTKSPKKVTGGYNKSVHIKYH